MRPLFLMLLTAAGALAQPITVGVKVGVPLTDFFSTVGSANFGFNSNTKRYIVGPTAELRLPGGFGVELDALYRRVNYTGTGSNVTSTATANSWEFPLLLKYRFSNDALRPFVDAGIAWNTLSGLKHSVLGAVGVSTAPASAGTSTGFVMGAGLDIKAVLIHISPEIRYTRWGSARFVDPLNLVRDKKNQAEFLLGITF